MSILVALAILYKLAMVVMLLPLLPLLLLLAPPLSLVARYPTVPVGTQDPVVQWSW